MDRAFETAPLSPVVNLSLAARSYYARQFPEAVEQSQKTLALDQAFVPAHTLLARVYTQQRSQKQALTEFKKALEISGGGTDELAALGYGYAAARQDSDAKKVLDEPKDRAQQTYVQPLGMASIHLALGQKDQAMDWPQAAFNNRSTGLVYLKVDPVFDPLRADARFVDLLRRMGM